MPKRSMPTTLPARPTYFHQRAVTPASMAMRLVHGRRAGLQLAIRCGLTVEALEARDRLTTRVPAPRVLGGVDGALEFGTAGECRMVSRRERFP